MEKILEEQSWRIKNGGVIMEEKALRRNRGGEIVGPESGGEFMKETS